MVLPKKRQIWITFAMFQICFNDCSDEFLELFHIKGSASAPGHNGRGFEIHSGSSSYASIETKAESVSHPSVLFPLLSWNIRSMLPSNTKMEYRFRMDFLPECLFSRAMMLIRPLLLLASDPTVATPIVVRLFKTLMCLINENESHAKGFSDK